GPAGAARGDREGGRADALSCQSLKGALDDAVFEGVKGDHRDPGTALEDAHRVVDKPVEPDQLLVRRDAQRLKGERGRIDVARTRFLHAANDAGELRGCLNGTRGDDGARDPARLRLLAVVAADARQLLFLDGV